VEKGIFLEDETVRVAGRVMTIRAQGQKLIFLDLEGDSTKVQLTATS
jgi:lysyl-tRNA synthetase class II